MKQTRKELASC